MGRGRPIGSGIRQNMINLLQYMRRAHGYQLYKAYIDCFSKVTLRVIYYHLKKGVSLGEFVVDTIAKEKGDYSWGGEAEKIYYKLGPEAKPRADPLLKAYMEKKKKPSSHK